MSDLRAELDAALRTIVPGEVPVEAAMRRGRRLRTRRRLAAVAGTAAVAVFATVGYPALTRPSAAPRPAPAQHQRIVVTDVPPGRGTPPGLIALGTVGRSSWKVSVEKPSGQHGKGALPQCYDITVGRPGRGETDCGLTYDARQEPVNFAGSIGAGDGSTETEIGPVAPDVTYIVVTLAGGQQLKLIPVSAYGARLVAYVRPVSDRVVSATAYLENGQYLTAVPFSQPGTMAMYGLWLRPGDHVPPTASAVLATGTPGTRSGRVTAYEGPWGTCFLAGSGDMACVPLARLAKTEVISLISGTPPQLVSGSAAANVTQVKVTLTNGDIVRAPVVAVGDEKLWACSLVKGQVVKHWTAYDAAGKQVATGALTPAS